MVGTLRKAERRDLPAISTIIEDGRAYLREQGLPQWQNGYGPTVADAIGDIERGEGYVFTSTNNEQETIFAYAALIRGVDLIYENIRDGAWNTAPTPYISIHRVAVARAARGQGLAKIFLKCLISEAVNHHFYDVRIDTHEGNKIMRHVVTGAGFVYRGRVFLPFPNGERLAYQLVINGR